MSEENQEAPERSVGPFRFLVVDDNTIIRKLIATLLRSIDCELVEAVDGEDALSQLEGETFDLVILDIMMPGMNGLEVAGKIREIPAMKKLPIVFCTSVGDRRTILDAANLGPMDYVVKPLNRQVLADKIAGLLGDGMRDQEPVNEGAT